MSTRRTRWPALSGRTWALVAALAVAAAAVAPALAAPGIVATRAAGDSPFLLLRVHQMAYAVASGHVPARWMPDAAYGLGYPFWNFYAPLAYVLAAVVALVGGGVVGAIKVTALGMFLIAAGGAFRLGERAWGTPAAGLVASAAYTLAPYHIVNLYVRGDALSELAAYALLPWVLLAVDRAAERRSAAAVAVLAVSLALLLTSHNVSALLMAPVVLAWALWRVLAPGGARPAGGRSVPHRSGGPVGSAEALPPAVGWERLPAAVWHQLLELERRFWPWLGGSGHAGLAVGAGLALGLALAAWFVAPALLERDAVHLAENVTGYFRYDGHFKGRDLVHLGPLFDYTVGDDGCTPCRNGLAQLAVALGGLLLGLRLAARRGALVFWAGLALVATFMVTPLSAPLWARVPLLEFAQFPWRWLSVQALGLAVLSGAAAATAGRRGGAVAGAIVVVLAVSALARLPMSVLSVRDVTRADITAFELFSGNIGSTVRAEYLPRDVDPRPVSAARALTGRAGRPRAVTGTVESAALQRETPTRQVWRVGVTGGLTTTVAFPTLWFPGWAVSIDEGPPGAAGVVEGSGWLTADVPAGTHTVTLELGRSGTRAVAEGLSLAALLFTLGLWLVDRRRHVGRRLVVIGLLIGLVVFGARLMPTGPAPFPDVVDGGTASVGLLARLGERVPLLADGLARLDDRLERLRAELAPGEAATGPITLDFARMPWPHANPEGVAYGASRLVEAALSDDAAQAGEDDIELTLAWYAPTVGATVEAALVSPAAVQFGVPDLHASADGLQEARQSLLLDVPEHVPSGLYFVRLGVTDDAGEDLPPRDADGSELGAVHLGPVRVRGKPDFRAVPDVPVARMGDFTLHAVRAPQAGRLLQVEMYWEVARRQVLDYKTSVRLKDGAGEPVLDAEGQPVQDDKMPLYGFYPTTAWEPGEQVLDRRWLSLPDGIPSGDDYQVEVVLYDGHGEVEIGHGGVGRVQIVPPPAE